MALLATLLPPLAVAGWLAAATLGALIARPGEAPGRGVTVALLGSAIHYDFLLPATPDARTVFGFAARAGVPVDDPRAAWILAGWGARRFYTSAGTYADIRLGPVRAAVTGDASVLRVDALGPIDTGGLPRLTLSPAQYARLLDAIAATRAGGALPDAGFTGTDAFFVAHGRFDALRTCNVWVGAMLRAAGLRFGAWTPTPASVRLALRRAAARGWREGNGEILPSARHNPRSSPM